MDPLVYESSEAAFAIDPTTILDCRSQPQVLPARGSGLAVPGAAGSEPSPDLAAAAGVPPDILQRAVEDFMRRYGHLVHTTAATMDRLVREPQTASLVRSLNAVDWKAVSGGQVTPHTVDTARRVYRLDAVRQVEQAAESQGAVAMSVGVAAAFQLGLGGEGGAGLMDTILKGDGDPLRGAAWVAGRFGLGGEISASLQFGFYFVPRRDVAGFFAGGVLSLKVGAGGAVAIYIKPYYPFAFIGFSISVGVGLAASLSLVAGHTWIF